MILRVVNGHVPDGRFDAVVDAFRRGYVPIARNAEGLDRYVVAARPASRGGHELVSMTIWSTVEAALAAYGGNVTSVRTLDDRGHGETLSRVDYYEIDEGGARRQGEVAGQGEAPGRTGTPARLRLTAGSVARGLGADIQQELRLRLPELPPEAIEAYVGRRVLGAAVEIALVTMWSAAPAGMALDQPLWPDISNRYDAFRVAVFDILVEGAGRG
jgi:hypothetical protein